MTTPPPKPVKDPTNPAKMEVMNNKIENKRTVKMNPYFKEILGYRKYSIFIMKIREQD